MTPLVRFTSEEAQALVSEHGGINPAARAAGCCPKTLRRALRRDPCFEFPRLPSQDRSIEETIEARKQEFARRDDYERAHVLIPVAITIPGPVAIAHFGDPHLDDPGCDIGLFEHHLSTVNSTDGMMAANVGDMQNNWVGRLAHLWAQQTVTARESQALVRWMIDACDWLYLIGGNHDAWAGQHDALEWIAAQAGAHLRYHGVRLALQFQNGREVRVNARHDFRGWSQWNEAHGPMKAARLAFRDHILTCGHKHVSAYGIVADPDPTSDVIAHCIRVASYKVHDTYAMEKGLLGNFISPCCVTVIDPDAEDPAGLVTVLWDIDSGAEYLTWLRTKRGFSDGTRRQVRKGGGAVARDKASRTRRPKDHV